MPLERGHVYVAPGGRHLVVESRYGTVWAVQADTPPVHSCRPAVDVLFGFVAEVYARALGVVLTGMGYDGCAGSQAIVAQGGSVLAQDEASSAVWGMPGAVARAGLADRVLPLSELAGAITAKVAARPSASAGSAPVSRS